MDSCGQLERVVDRSVLDSLVWTVVDREFVYTVYARPAECQTGRAMGKTSAASYWPGCSVLLSSAVCCITEWCSALQYWQCTAVVFGEIQCSAAVFCEMQCSILQCCLTASWRYRPAVVNSGHAHGLAGSTVQMEVYSARCVQ